MTRLGDSETTSWESETMSDTPKFKHHCDACAFLGHVEGHDLYICRGDLGPDNPSLLARYGDRPHEYQSALVSAVKAWPPGNEPLQQALTYITKEK